MSILSFGFWVLSETVSSPDHPTTQNPKLQTQNLIERMKTFFGSFFGTLFAILFLIAAGVVGCVAVIALLVSASGKGPTVASNSLLVLDLAVPIMDAPQEFDPAQLLA